MALVTKSFSDIITFTRTGTSGTYFNSAGVLVNAGANVPRFDYNPATLAARGLLIEEQRTNSIRNNTMVGAVAGTPGTLPTNWTGGTVIQGVNRTIVGTGTENGITYIDVRYSGTSTGSASQSQIIQFESVTNTVAANGQTWTGAEYFRLVGGDFTNVTLLTNRLLYKQADGTTNNEGLNGTNLVGVLTNANLTTQRFSLTRATATASTAYIAHDLIISFSSGVAIDFTLRIGLPQLELGAFATSVIPTTTTALTRSADVASVNTLSPWYNATEGTLFAQASLISSSYSQGVLVDLGAGGAFGTTEYVNWSGTGWILNPNIPPINVASSIATTSTAKVAAGLKANDSVISANGLIGATDTSCGIVAAPTTLSIGKAGWALGNYFNGWIQRITYYPRRLSNAELQAITA